MKGKIWTAAIGLLALTTAAHAGTRRQDIPEGTYTAFAADPMFAAVGGLLLKSALDAGKNPMLCTVTLIKPDAVLTAGHCLYDESGKQLKGSQLIVAFGPQVDKVAAGTVAVAGIQFHPQFEQIRKNWPKRMGIDLAVLKLAQPVGGIAPMRLHTAGLEQQGDATLRLAGYGVRGTGESGYLSKTTAGLKLAGLNQIKKIGFHHPIYTDMDLLEYEFDRPSDVPSGFSEFMIGPGDSGGPALVLKDGHAELAGVHHGGMPVQSLPTSDPDVLFYGNGKYGTTGWSIRVFTYVAWIRKAAGLL